MKRFLSLFMSVLMVFSCFAGSITTAHAAVNSPIPGDINGDGNVNTKDLTRLLKFVSGEDVEVVADTLDTNGDGNVNTKDLSRLMGYLSGDPNKPLPDIGCSHEMTATPASEATCTEEGNIAYWYCSKCDKYFSDDIGAVEIKFEDIIIAKLEHTVEIIPGYPATMTETGLSEGKKCSVCNYIIQEQEIIPISEFEVAYRHYVLRKNSFGTAEIVNDDYLSTHEIVNPNPSTYTQGTGIDELIEGFAIDGKKVSTKGYTFLGWYERPEATANRVYSISKESTGKKVLYGIWSKDAYKITYIQDSASSTLPKVDDGSYSIDTETSLATPPIWPNLVWIGWSNEDGQVVKSIPKGSTGDITLTANWMSKRSQTVPNTKYADSMPAITVDEASGVYAFTYEIGDIQNVPIQAVEDGLEGNGFNLVKGETKEIKKTFTQKIGVDEATGVANTISKATTKSDSWTLSENWNQSTSFSQEHSNEVSEEQSQKAIQSFSSTGKYSLSAGIGGSEEHIDETGKSTKVSSKHELGVGVNVGIKADLKASVTKGTPFKNASVSGNLGLDYKYTKETENTTHETHTDKTSSYWNVNEGFEKSATLSGTDEFAHSVSQSIKDTFKYSETLDFGGTNSNTVSSSNTSSDSREYSSSVTYSTEEGSEIEVSETLTADADTGFYRKVLAANFKVFAVVIYDMKTNTYSTMTHSLKIKGSEHLFTDYSLVSSFDDYENGVLPFEVPNFVGDYVYGLIGGSEGIRVNPTTGMVDSYGYKDPTTGICYKNYDDKTGIYSNPCDTDVIIPRYVVVKVDNNNNNNQIIPVTGIATATTKTDSGETVVASAFSGTTITSVYLSDRITAIPTNAFANCSSLKYVRGGMIESIGDKAFENCTSLYEFDLPNIVSHLGTDAFNGVNAITIDVFDTSVFDSALDSGIRRLSMSLEGMEGTIDGKKIETPADMEYFSLSGGGREFNNVSINSDAESVVLRNITINNYSSIPLKLNTENIELGFVTINASNLVLRSDEEDVFMTLDGNNYLTSSGKNAMISRNMHFAQKEGSSASGKLLVTGNISVYGNTTGTQCVEFSSGDYTFIYITQEEYEKMLTSCFVYFNANGGSVDIASRQVYVGGTYGELPVPVRENCTFDGWFTEDGVEVTETTPVEIGGDVTLKAHWSSDWVLESSLPSDGTVISEKWTYDKTTNITSSSKSEEGYTLYNTTSAWGSYGSWSSWSKTKATASDSRQVETKTVTDQAAHTKYKYSIYRTSDGWGYGTKNYNTGSHGACTKYDEVYLSYKLPVYNSSLKTYGPYNSSMFSHSGDSYWFYDGETYVAAVTHTEYRYRDRSLVYTYYHTKTERLESEKEITAEDAGANESIENIEKRVKYTVQ